MCDQPLVGHFQNETWGIKSSASYWNRTPHGAVIFGAPDPDVGYGSSRLFALDAMNGEMIWKSEVVAEFNGDVLYSIKELHERIAYSSPLIFNQEKYLEGEYEGADSGEPEDHPDFTGTDIEVEEITETLSSADPPARES